MNGPIQVEFRDAVLVVTLNRPTANAIDVPTSRLMGKRLQNFEMIQRCESLLSRGPAISFFVPAGI